MQLNGAKCHGVFAIRAKMTQCRYDVAVDQNSSLSLVEVIMMTGREGRRNTKPLVEAKIAARAPKCTQRRSKMPTIFSL